MPTSKQLGDYYEKRSMEYLKKMGCTVERAYAKTIWIRGRPISIHHDFFGVGDLMFVSKDGAGLVQTKFKGEATKLWLAEVRRRFAKLPNPPKFVKAIHIWEKGARMPEVELVL